MSSRTGARAVVESITAQGKLTAALAAQIAAADTKSRLEDIYLPFKPKRRTKAQIAREAGLEPLADLLIGDPSRDPQRAAAGYVSAERGVAGRRRGAAGARSILVERFGEDADLVGELRELLWKRGRLSSTVRDRDAKDASKFADYFDFSQPLKTLPSHRVLAMFRGEAQGVLTLTVDPDPAATGERVPTPTHPLSDYERRIAGTLPDRRPRPPGRPLAAGHGPLGVADPAAGLARHRPARPAPAGRRAGRGGGVRREPARPAAGRAGRQPDHARSRPRIPDRGQGGRRRRAPARWSPPTRSTRTSRRTAGKPRWTP